MPSISPGALPRPALLPCTPPHWPTLPLSHPRRGQHPEGGTFPWPVAFQPHHFSQLLPQPIFSSPLIVPPLRSDPELCIPAEQGSPGPHVLPVPKTALLTCHFTHLSCQQPQPLTLPCSAWNPQPLSSQHHSPLPNKPGRTAAPARWRCAFCQIPRGLRLLESHLTDTHSSRRPSAALRPGCWPLPNPALSRGDSPSKGPSSEPPWGLQGKLLDPMGPFCSEASTLPAQVKMN